MQYNPIADLSAYNNRMSQGLLDKLFFLDKIETDSILDFGCADGTLLKAIQQWMPDIKLVGYDNDSRMIELASKNVPEAKFSSNFEEAYAACKGKSTVVLSSILHEVYHYQEPHEVDQFWKDIFYSERFQTIVIRDMIPSRMIDRKSDLNDLARVYRYFSLSQYPEQLKDFENIWGSIERNKNLMHFLLKYNYRKPNWDREVRENYFPLYFEDLFSFIPFEYRILYTEHFVLPYIFRSVNRDMGVEIKDPTHLKLILEKR